MDGGECAKELAGQEKGQKTEAEVMPFCECERFVSDIQKHQRRGRCGLKGKIAWHKALKNIKKYG